MALSHTKKSRSELRVMPEEDPDFQIAPMIDILLVLLVFFMSISSTQVLQSNQQVQLPVAAKAKQKKDETAVAGQTILNVLWVPLANKGSITVDEASVDDPNRVIPLLQERLKLNPKLRVLVRADRRAPYSFIRPLLVAIGQAGATNITFSVLNKDDQNQGGAK